MIENIWLLSQSDTLICFVWSKFCALAYELQYARDDFNSELIDVLNGYVFDCFVRSPRTQIKLQQLGTILKFSLFIVNLDPI